MNDKNLKRGPHAAKNRPLKDQIAEIENGASSVDERKTVILDEDLEGVEFEDRVWLYWKRNKNFIISTVVLAVAIVIGVQGFKIYKAQSASRLASEFEAAASPEQLAQFAAKNPGTKLAGVALLENADSAFSAGKFADAEKLYSESSDSLKGNILFGRAKLGEAVAAYSADKASGVKKLSETYANQEIDRAYRAQAGYLLALALQQDKKIDEAKKIFKEIASDMKNGVFANIAQNALSRIE